MADGLAVPRQGPLSSLAVDELHDACVESHQAVMLRDPEALGKQNRGQYLFGAISLSVRLQQVGASRCNMPARTAASEST